jgi:hypothetical protein
MVLVIVYFSRLPTMVFLILPLRPQGFLLCGLRVKYYFKSSRPPAGRAGKAII